MGGAGNHGAKGCKMSFTISNSPQTAHVYAIDHVEMLLQTVHDELEDDATQAQIDDLLCQYIVGDLRQPKTLKTVRGHLLRYWPLIAPLANREPDLFDQILLEFCDRATSLS